MLLEGEEADDIEAIRAVRDEDGSFALVAALVVRPGRNLLSPLSLSPLKLLSGAPKEDSRLVQLDAR